MAIFILTPPLFIGVMDWIPEPKMYLSMESLHAIVFMIPVNITHMQLVRAQHAIKLSY